MRKRIFTTLRSRLMLAHLAMLFPLLLLSYVSYTSFERIMASFDEVLVDSLNEIKPITRLEYAILDLSVPLHGYLIHGGKDEITQYIQRADVVDSSFAAVRKLKSLKPEQQVVLQGIEKEWKDNRKLADKIVSYKPPFSAESTVMMELFDLRLKKINDKLAFVREAVYQEIVELNNSAKRRHRKSIDINTLIFISSTVVAILIGFFMSKTITRQLADLEHAANEFRTGHMSYRISSKSEDEIGRLSQTFNIMAQEIENLVTHDPLTELLNRREFDRLVENEVERSRRFKQPVSLIIADIDHFKQVNDVYGHQVGDIVLRLVSSVITRQTRSIDHVARYGGEELVIILPQISKQDALHKAEVVRQSIENEVFYYNETDSLRITISLGVATFDEDADDVKGLVSAADMALYAAKNNGRNRVEPFRAT